MIRDAQGCQMVSAGSFMLLSRRIWNQRLICSDVERMLWVAALGHPEADQVRALAKHLSSEERAAIAAPHAPGAHNGRVRHARHLGDLIEMADVLRTVRARAGLELPRIRGPERIQVHYKDPAGAFSSGEPYTTPDR